MTSSEASYLLGRVIGRVSDHTPEQPRFAQALLLAKRALDILTTLDERLGLNEPVTIENRELEWHVTLGHRTHVGSDPTDALQQLCATLTAEAPDIEWAVCPSCGELNRVDGGTVIHKKGCRAFGRI